MIPLGFLGFDWCLLYFGCFGGVHYLCCLEIVSLGLVTWFTDGGNDAIRLRALLVFGVEVAFWGLIPVFLFVGCLFWLWG